MIYDFFMLYQFRETCNFNCEPDSTKLNPKAHESAERVATVRYFFLHNFVPMNHYQFSTRTKETFRKWFRLNPLNNSFWNIFLLRFITSSPHLTASHLTLPHCFLHSPSSLCFISGFIVDSWSMCSVNLVVQFWEQFSFLFSLPCLLQPLKPERMQKSFLFSVEINSFFVRFNSILEFEKKRILKPTVSSLSNANAFFHVSWTWIWVWMWNADGNHRKYSKENNNMKTKGGSE